MSNPYRLVVFDWEGTISDTLGQVLHTVATEAEKLGYGAIDPAVAKQYVDLGLSRAVKKLFPKMSAAEHEQLMQSVQHTLLTSSVELCLIPGVLNFIKQLHDEQIELAIATNKGHQSLMRALQATGLDVFFKVTRSAGAVPAKPCPQMLEEIMNEFGRDARSTLMIGDSPSDMDMASRIHVDAIGVDFYNQQEAILKHAGAKIVFNDYQQLAQFWRALDGHVN